MAVTINVSFEAASSQEAFTRLAGLGANLQPVMEEFGAGFVTAISRRFETESDPDGRKWVKNRRGGMVLTDTGILANSFSSRAGRDQVEVGTAVPYAAIHQTGGVIKPKNGKALAFAYAGGFAVVKSVTIPERPFLGIGQAEKDVVNDVVKRNVFAALRARGGSGPPEGESR
jgi:phage virion morphogenesis protein